MRTARPTGWCCSLWLLASLAASCSRTSPGQPAAASCSASAPCPTGQRCSTDGRCAPQASPHTDAAVSGDAALAESRVPDAGAAPRDAAASQPPYHVTGALGAVPAASGPGYQLLEQRFELVQPSCARLADDTLCVSGSLH